MEIIQRSDNAGIDVFGASRRSIRFVTRRHSRQIFNDLDERNRKDTSASIVRFAFQPFVVDSTDQLDHLAFQECQIASDVGNEIVQCVTARAVPENIAVL